jgi:hypothetical protein
MQGESSMARAKDAKHAAFGDKEGIFSLSRPGAINRWTNSFRDTPELAAG